MSVDTADYLGAGSEVSDQSDYEDAFDLDIRIVESGDMAASLVNLTDDNCGSTCPKACATAVV